MITATTINLFFKTGHNITPPKGGGEMLYYCQNITKHNKKHNMLYFNLDTNKGEKHNKNITF